MTFDINIFNYQPFTYLPFKFKSAHQQQIYSSIFTYTSKINSITIFYRKNCKFFKAHIFMQQIMTTIRQT